MSVDDRLARLTPEQRAALAGKLAAAKAGPPLRRRPGPRDRFPLGLDQERLWLLDQLDPGSTTYTLSFGLRFRGAFDEAALIDAAHAVVRRHELLRSVVVVDDGRPELVVRPDAPVPVRRLDLRGVPDAEQRLAEFVAEQVDTPFDLTTGPLLRLGIVRLADDEHQVCETMHHSVTDQWSYVRLNRELLEHYRAALEDRVPDVPELPVQFGDFAHWQRELFAADHRHREFWRDHLAGAPTTLPLPYDGSPDTADHAGAHHRFVLDERVGAAFRQHTRDRRTTLATSLLAVYVALLFEETGERDIVVGLPSVTRSRPESRDLIGFLLTNVPVRVRLPADPTPDDVLRATTAASAAVAEHREVPFAEIVSAVSPDRSATRYPLLQTMHLVLDFDDTIFHVPGAEVYANGVRDGVSPMDLTVGWWRAGDLMYGRFEYRTALFRPATVDRLARRLLTLVDVFTREPGTPLRPRAVPVASAPSVLSARTAEAPDEDRLARARQAWCEALDLPDAAPDDTFFDVGGTSVLAVKLTNRLRAAGFTATVRDVFTHPTLAGLAALPRADRTGAAPRSTPDSAPAGPEQELLLTAGMPAVERWAHTLVLDPGGPVDADRLRDAVAAVVAAHPGLTTTFRHDGRWTAHRGDRWGWLVTGDGPDEVAHRQRAGFDIASGPLFAAALAGDRVVLTAAHLVIDGLSWDVVVDDLARAYAGEPLPAEPVDPLAHAAALRAVSAAPQADYWRTRQQAVRPVAWSTGEPTLQGDVVEVESTAPLTTPGTYQAEALTAVARALRPLTEDVVLTVVALGREPVAALPYWDGARSVGYHACSYPLHVPSDDPAVVAAALRAVPDGGKGYGLLRAAGELPPVHPAVSVNYVGALGADPGPFRRVREIGPTGNDAFTRTADVDVVVAVAPDRVVFRWRYSPRAVRADLVREVADRAAEAFTAVVSAVDAAPGETALSDARMDELSAELSRARRAAG
ncbi:condensation domain-containing protein [Saccharothrix obliqua]|uniref:condensation domain-containing protein n=1 Tax=Saccharothrix obliqua TaxID=2861747 RepID=UPI001C5DA35F|nr:condensation domain-containing protein [Saccharothrix obliqua]MBW4718329.1 hypothetical protein [Saccharothrix obliqua]